MSFTLTFGWWAIPLAITIISLMWSTYCSRGGYFDGVFETLFALIISLLSWAIAGALK